MKKLAFSLLAASVAISAAALDIKIYEGPSDTVRVATQTIVANTAPGASVTVNGNPVDVNSVGSFAAKVDLAPGDNTVTICATADGETAVKTLSLFRAEPKEKAAKETKQPSETIFSTPFFVESNEGAFLQYGSGDDRLGGSKMGFIAAGIPLKIVGESGDLYKVQLSAQRWAWIEKEHTVPTTTHTATVNTGSWSIVREDRVDRISVALPCRLPYRYYTLLDPSTIVVELFGATDNSNWITQRSATLGIVDYVNFEQRESDVYAIIIRLKEQYQWGFSIDYAGNSLSIAVRHSPANLTYKGVTIGLDAGHGGKYPGAWSPSGLSEKEVNLDIVLRTAALLEKAGAKVVLTRRTVDDGPSMAERKKIFRDGNVDLAISVHNNWTPDPFAAPGTSTYYKHLFDRPLAQALLSRMLETGLNLYGLVGNFNFSLNGPTDYPNALVEAMFMNSLREEELLADPAFRQKVANAIYLAIGDYLAAARRSRQ